jgi:hypothetical protein
MIRLPDVTLLAATSVSIDDTLEALNISARDIDFGAVKLLSPLRSAHMPSETEHIAIPSMDLLGYSRFMLGNLYRHFDTSHCLVVQADGFIVNPQLWRDEFLAYDYVGAPWPEYVGITGIKSLLRLDRNRVGNGGFSLRSHKLMRIAAAIDFDRLNFPLRSEDLVLCHFLYEEMRAQGVTYAPPELAALFSMESTAHLFGQHLDSVFGFHGKNLLSEVLMRLPETAFADLRARLRWRNTPTRSQPSRNELCPCRSGKRFKHCHGRLA